MINRFLRFGPAAAALAASAALFSASALAQTPNFELEGGPGSPRTAPRAAAPQPVAPQTLAQQDYRGSIPDGRDWRDYDDRNNRDDRDWRDDEWRRGDRSPDFQTVQRECSRAAIEEGWRRGFYSAQYHDGPRLVSGVRGWEMRGQVRLHDRKGFHYTASVCEWDRGRVAGFAFTR
jgi:hypothetical protein